MNCPKCGKEMSENIGKVPNISFPFSTTKPKSKRVKAELKYFWTCCGSKYYLGLSLIEFDDSTCTRKKAW